MLGRGRQSLSARLCWCQCAASAIKAAAGCKHNRMNAAPSSQQKLRMHFTCCPVCSCRKLHVIGASACTFADSFIERWHLHSPIPPASQNVCGFHWWPPQVLTLAARPVDTWHWPRMLRKAHFTSVATWGPERRTHSWSLWQIAFAASRSLALCPAV